MIMYERSGVLLQQKFREYLIPTILTVVALLATTIIDSIIVGHLLGETALSTIGLTSPVIYSFNAIFVLFVVGGVTCASIARGRRETDNSNSYFTLTFLVGMVVMSLFTLILLLFTNPIANALAQGDDLLASLTRDYLRPLVFMGPVMMLIMGTAQFVRADGKPKISARIALTANIINLILTYIFIRFMGMGIGGASLANVCGYLTAFVVLIPYIRSKERGFRFHKPVKGCVKQVLEMMNTGSPKALTHGLSFLRGLVLNAIIVSALGVQGMAAMMICINSLLFATVFIGGTTETLLPIVGTLFGEKDYPGIRFTVRTGFRFMVIACLAVMALFLILPGYVVQIFGITEGLKIAESALRLYALSLPFYGINTLLLNYYQTTGRVKLANLIVTLNGFALVVLFAFAFSIINADLIWLSFALSELITFIIVMIAGLRIRKKSNLKGVLLLAGESEGISLDLSIPATNEAAVGISAQIINFLNENNIEEKSAMRMGIAVEEMAVNTAKYGHRNSKGLIDVLIRIVEGDLILRLRDNGEHFDPTQYYPEEVNDFAIGGIEIVRRLAKDINYSRQLGFNISVITIAKES